MLLNLIYFTDSNKPLKNIKEVKQGLVKIWWEETHQKNVKTISCSMVK